jgi:hypothetical protein
MNSHFVFALFMFAVLLAFTPARAQTDNDPIGKIIEIEGKVWRAVGNEKAEFKVDDDVYSNDIIFTDPASRAEIMFIDDTQITLGENTTLKLDKYVFDPDNLETASGDFSVMKGSFLFVSGLLTKNQKPDVHVKTSYGTIGLRGTIVWGGKLDDDYGVLVQEGEVDVVNGGGTTTVPTGQGTFMKNFREKPRVPKAWAAEKTDRAVKTIAFLHPEELAKKIAARKLSNVNARKDLVAVRKKRETLREQLQNPPADQTPAQRKQISEEYKRMRLTPNRPMPERYNIKMPEAAPEEQNIPQQTPVQKPAATTPRYKSVGEKIKAEQAARKKKAGAQ